MKDYPIVLSIAGSDPSGGAGIQADIKAISACGGYAATAITAVTVQNTVGVSEVEYMKPELVAAQIDAVMSDLAVDAVKIGMTGTVPIVEAIAGQLAVHPVLYVVTDPVMVSTSKDSLTMPEAVDALCSCIFPKSIAPGRFPDTVRRGHGQGSRAAQGPLWLCFPGQGR